MFVFITLTITLFEILVIFNSTLALWICRLMYNMKGNSELTGRLRKLQQEQSAISMQKEFAKYHKIQRNINKLTAELNEQSEAKKMTLTKVSYTLKTIIYAFYVI